MHESSTAICRNLVVGNNRQIYIFRVYIKYLNTKCHEGPIIMKYFRDCNMLIENLVTAGEILNI